MLAHLALARGRYGALLVVLLGCHHGTPALPPPPTVPEQVDSGPATGKTHRFRDNYGEPGCEPKGEALTLRGRIRVEPFGKGTDGALLDEDGGEAWVLSYRAEGVLLQLDGAQVEVRGHACDKQGEALSGKHFDLETLVEPAP
jgi:hypothetical protein